MRDEESNDLQRVFITDRAQAATPWIAVPIGRKQVPPRSHLSLKAGLEFLHHVGAPDVLRSKIHISGIFVGVAVKTAGWERVVGMEVPVDELLGGSIENIVHVSVIGDDAKLIIHGGEP